MVDHFIKEAPSLCRRPFRWNGPNHITTVDGGSEGFKVSLGKNPTNILDDNGIAQIGLIVAIFAHGVIVGDARERRGCMFFAGEFAEDSCQKLFDDVEHVILCSEAHLHIELVELARRAVGTRVFVTKARGDLEVAVKAGDHQQLLELLRGLRQCIKLAWVQSTWHEKIACTFRRTAGQNRRLKLIESQICHPPADA